MPFRMRSYALLLGLVLSAGTCAAGRHRATQHDASAQTSLFGHRYRLDTPDGLRAYAEALEREIARSKRDEPLGDAYAKDPVHHKRPRNYIDGKLRDAMKETRKCVVELLDTPEGDDHARLAHDLVIMAGALRASYARVLPPSMDVSTALIKQGRIEHPPVGLARSGPAVDLAGAPREASNGEARGSRAHMAAVGDTSHLDPVLPSSYWNKPANISRLDLYYGFGRKELPELSDIVCTYRRPKTSRGVHGGYEVKAGELGKVKLKFGEQHSQPFSQRIAWALGFNTESADCARTVKVKWDPRIITEYNSRQDELLKVTFLGIPVVRHHLQHALDPLASVAEIVMTDEQGREVTLRPKPTWDYLKPELYKDPSGKPYTRANNLRNEFTARIKYLVYHDVNVRVKDDEADSDDGTYLGNWDLDAPENAAMRENRGYAVLSGWLNQFDPPADNQKLYMTKKGGKRTFKHYYVDLGGSLGSASDARYMIPQDPNLLPWSFTRPAKAGSRAVPFDASYRTIVPCASWLDADIDDARWMARYIAELTGPQILQALVAAGLPSADVRLYYNKLANRRNQMLADFGMDYPPLALLDFRRDFDYDPHRDGLISITTVDGKKVAAPDCGRVVLHGRVYTRTQVDSGEAARDLGKHRH